MKIAILSDIHSNVFALEAVIKDFKKRGVTSVVNLGDILYGPIAPRKTYDLLMKHDFITIQGNQDRQIYEATEEEIVSNPTMQFILDDLGEEPLDWMASLPKTVQLNDDVFLCHGTPTDDLVYLLETIHSGHARVRSDDEILALLNGESSKVILCGHTHTPREVWLSSGQLVINSGSVGLQAYQDDLPHEHVMENYSPHARYSILEATSHGWQIEQIRVVYDHSTAAEYALKQNRLDWHHALLTGRAC